MITVAPPEPTEGLLEVRIGEHRAAEYVHATDSQELAAFKVLLAINRIEHKADREYVELGLVDFGGES